MEQKTRIKGNVHYVGVNDRNKHLFEGDVAAAIRSFI